MSPLESSSTASIFKWLWSEWFWLKPGVTWKDLEPDEDVPNGTHHTDLYILPFLMAFLIYVMRDYFLLPCVFNPLGQYYGVRSKPYRAPENNAILQRLYKVNRARPPQHLLQKCAKEVGWTERKVERWLRQMALSKQMTTLEKFSGFGFQFVYFTSAVVIGLIILPQENYFWDLRKCFEDYPKVIFPLGLKLYYMLTMGFYIVETFLLFKFTKRHDFYIMLIHHCCSLFILSFCYIAKFMKIVTLSILVHDVVDIFISSGKLFNYCGRTDMAKLMFVLFSIVWFPTRLVLFPLWIIRTTLFVGPDVYGCRWPSQYFLNTLNFILLALHCMWTKDLLAVINAKLFRNVEIVDTRSSPEEMSDDELKNNSNKKK